MIFVKIGDIYLWYSEVPDPAITKYFVVTSIVSLNLDI